MMRGGQSVHFRDPDGRLLELATPGLWPGYWANLRGFVSRLDGFCSEVDSSVAGGKRSWQSQNIAAA